MNKRTLLFVSLVSAAFLGCQIFFGYQDLKSCQAQAKKQRAISEQILASTELLSVVPWTASPEEEESVNQYAVRLGNRLLLLTKGGSLPEVYSKGTSWSLIDQTSTFGGILVSLYGESGQDVSSKGGSVYLPNQQDALPVLVTEFRRNQEPLVFLGEYKDGKISNKEGAIYGTSLVFLNTGNEFVPLGIYNSKEDCVESLDLPMARAVVFADKEKPAATGSYYMLSNEYMQVIVSQESGAVEGINLPFASDHEGNKSIVNEIGFDRELVVSAPAEASFPGVKAVVDSQRQNVLDVVGGYYPLLRRGILSGTKKMVPLQYQALNIVSGRELSSPVATGFRVVSFDDKTLILESGDGGIRKTYNLGEQPYAFELEIQTTREQEDLWITSGVPEVEIMSNAFVPAVKYHVVKKNKSNLVNVKLPKAKDPLLVRNDASPQWILNSNGYFGVILAPQTQLPVGYASSLVPGNTVPTRLSQLSPRDQAYPASKYPGYTAMLPLPKEAGRYQFMIYAGPLSEPTLKALDRAYTNSKGETPEYVDAIAFRGFFSFITEPFAALLFVIMKFFKFLTGSWGISIILLTIVLKLLLYPLNAWSIRSMRRMQKLSPYIQDIQQKYKREPKRAQMEIMALYKVNKVNPITGCLPLLVQIPFLIAMFDLLKSSFLLRGASFIPGWIDNLTAPDVLFSWETPIWFFGKEFHLLPFLLGIVMFAQQKISAVKRSGPVSDQQRQQEAMGTMMALLFTFMFYNFPSGLNIYWLSSMLLGVIQQWVTNKILDEKHLQHEVIVNKKR
ncbi:membrane protein insertase YidC [Chlamydia suis]|uniref:Membrane protein insertase YidC n=1 Tax=Chlamydia suis TaxID=83559 RepID=A0AAQ0EKY6_9CHLA|nr:membrane protein insertase YidC [Chlamydia suis]MEB2681063.1 membrane protein insertase YidC [Chlamydia suis]MEB2682067.1 membrane protein insertase YidC [Chlamydia suis]MEB2682990.1 membrane protein insertase YidC [Chlamydia suis]MEB2683771.1 membrane protein insertase YidC [Chlamydia suis]MEB2684804.1 membrane protein insertase YidC [Chlamydia suis]